MHLDFLVVGAGFFGSTVAERLAHHGHHVIVIDRRRHIGGNSFSEKDLSTGIELHRYGSHIFHTQNQRVWDYVTQFSTFDPYRHRVFTKHRDKVYHFPPNLQTLSEFYDVIRYVPKMAQAHIATFHNPKPKNFLEKGYSLVGKPLFDALYAGYSKKQWQTPLTELPASILNRLPLRFDYGDGYFDDPYQGIPSDGYGKLFQRMLDNKRIEVITNVNYADFLNSSTKRFRTVYTGPLDDLFRYRFGKLGWRSVRFQVQTLDIPDYQGTSVMNYADASVPYTRIHEFKHFQPHKFKDLGRTVIYKEFPKTPESAEDCYYPIRSADDMARYDMYKKALSEKYAVGKDFFIGGRLAEYKYYDMDATIASALSLADKLLSKKTITG